MSKFVRQWVQSIEIRKVRVRNERDGPYDSKPLTPAHKEVLLFLATKARDNGRTWVGMEAIAEATGTLRRQAQRNVRDLEAGGLLKTEQFRGRSGRKRYSSNEYWVRVPWVQEPANVTDLPPQPINIERVIDVDDYIRRARVAAVNASPVNASPVTHIADPSGGKCVTGDAESALNASPVTSKCVTGDHLNASPVTPKPGSLNPALNSSPVEPGSARERAREDVPENEREPPGHQLALLPAVSLGSATGPEEPAPVQRECPDCGQRVAYFTALNGRGHVAGCWRYGVPASHPWFARPRAEVEAEMSAIESGGEMDGSQVVAAERVAS